MKIGSLLLALCLLTHESYGDIGIWTNFQKDAAHTGYVNAATASEKFQVTWEREFWQEGDRYVKGTTQGVVTDHLLIFTIVDFSNTPGIYALDKKTGSTVWQKQLEKDSYLSGPVYANGSVYITQFQGSIEHDNGFIQAYDAETGALRYATPLSMKWYDTYQEPVIFNDHLYVAKRDQQYSINTQTGTVDWLQPAGDSNQLLTVTDNFIIRTHDTGIDVVNRLSGKLNFFLQGIDTSIDWNKTAPIWDKKNQTVYVTLTPESDLQPGWVPTVLVAFDLKQKKVKWKLALPFVFQPAVADNKLYFSSDAKLYEVDALTGAINWTWQSPTAAEELLVVGDHVFISDYHGNKTYAVSRTTHDKVWEINAQGHMSADANTLYIISEGYVGARCTAVALN